MVWDVNFMIPTVHEVPDSSEMFKTVVTWIRLFMTRSVIVHQVDIDQDI